MRTAATLLVAMGLLVACGPEEEATAPPPEPLTADATGFFCRMGIAEHAGPKAQLFVADRAGALWFPSVRDLFTYLRLPDVDGRMVGAWVSDTARLGPGGDVPDDAWVDARAAFYVLDSGYDGGMGRSEAVPFRDEAAARAFIAREGGRLARFEDIDAGWVFADAARGEPGS